MKKLKIAKDGHIKKLKIAKEICIKKLKIAKEIWKEFNLSEKELIKFVDVISSWVAGKNTKKEARSLFNNVTKIRKKAKFPDIFLSAFPTVYRGISLKRKDVIKFSEADNGKGRFKSDFPIESWSGKRQIAENFARRPEFSDPIGILFKKKGSDVDVFLNMNKTVQDKRLRDISKEMGRNIWNPFSKGEKEVLINSDVLRNEDVWFWYDDENEKFGTLAKLLEKRKKLLKWEELMKKKEKRKKKKEKRKKKKEKRNR